MTVITDLMEDTKKKPLLSPWLFVGCIVLLFFSILSEILIAFKSFKDQQNFLLILDLATSVLLVPLIWQSYRSRRYMAQKNDELRRLRSKISHFTKDANFATLQYKVKEKELILWDDTEGKPRHVFSLEEYWTRIYPDDISIAQKLVQLINSGESKDFVCEYRYRYTDDPICTWQFNYVFPYEMDSDGRVSSYLCISRKNNRWHKLYDDLQRFRKRIAFVADSANIIFNYYDVPTDTFYRLDNRGEEPDYVIALDELLRYVFVDDRDVAREKFNQMREHKDERIHFDFRYSIQKNDEYSWYNADLIAFDHTKEGEISSYLCLNVNTDHWHEAMFEVNRLSAKAQLLRMVAEKLSTIGKKFRTPLNAVMGFSDVMTEEESEQQRKEYRKIIDDNSLMLLKMSDDVLALAQLESDDHPFNLRPFVVAPFFNQWSEKFCHTIDREIHIEYQSDENIKVRLDPFMLERILTSILNYVVNYTQSGRIIFKVWKKEADFYFSVSDASFSISEEEQNYIFTHFDNYDHSSKYIPGMGLPFCKFVMTKDKGDIVVASSPENGTTFTCWIPTVIAS